MTRYDRFGVIQYSTKFTNGTGLQKRFHYYGQLEREGNLNRMDYEGDWTFYFDNGLIQSKGVFKSDEKEGIWKGYFENGKTRSITTYEEG